MHDRRADKLTWRSLLFVFTLLLVIFNALACSIQDNYGLLSTFFDGVPDPESLRQQSVTIELMGPPLPPAWNAQTYRPGQVKIYTHVPWEMQLCNRCHLTSRGKRVDAANAVLRGAAQLRHPKNRLCLSCHERVERNFTHAPVNQGRCLLCHDPHKAAHEHNLIQPVDQLCARCHQGDTFTLQKKHEKEPYVNRQCNDCHDPHGADRPFLLKGNWKEGTEQERVPSMVLQEKVKLEFEQLRARREEEDRKRARDYNQRELEKQSKNARDAGKG